MKSVNGSHGTTKESSTSSDSYIPRHDEGGLPLGLLTRQLYRTLDMTNHEVQSFFTPDEFSCQQDRLLSSTYNLAHVLLNRCQSNHLFIPIRSMQYLAIIERDSFWFVDSMAYAVRGEEGGRLITVSWHPLLNAGQRDSLGQHMDCRVIYYGGDMSEIQTRLRGEFFQAMQLVDERYRASLVSDGEVSILPLRFPEE